MRYELYYWPEIQGRGEFVRLALEDAGADYTDVAREPGGTDAMIELMGSRTNPRPSFAPPFLRAGRQLIGQTALILDFLGRRHGLAPESESGRTWALQLQLTISDLVVEIHDTHHPVAAGLYYEEQRDEAARRSRYFLDQRLPKFLGWFERIIADNPSASGYAVGRHATHVDLSLFQIVEGLRYAFPRAMARCEPQLPHLVALRERIADRPGIANYLSSSRRIKFNEMGIFRHYSELDIGA
jgi:glutathione S-transferase